MSKTETAPKIDPNNALTWPENSPAVAMDVNLGKNNRDYTVNMPEINRILDEEGIGKERRKLRIMIEPKSTNEWGRPLHGGYSADKKIRIATKSGFLGSHSKDSKIDDTVKHELGHFIDDVRVRRRGKRALELYETQEEIYPERLEHVADDVAYEYRAMQIFKSQKRPKQKGTRYTYTDASNRIDRTAVEKKGAKLVRKAKQEDWF